MYDFRLVSNQKYLSYVDFEVSKNDQIKFELIIFCCTLTINVLSISHSLILFCFQIYF